MLTALPARPLLCPHILLDTPRSQSLYRCEVCHFEYRFLCYRFACFLAHPLTVSFIFIVVLLSMSFVVGFIPVIQSLIRWAASPYAPLQ